MTTVSLVHGPDRYFCVNESLRLLRPELAQKIKGKKKIVIKPNFVSTSKQLAATHVDAVRAVLDTVTELSDQPVTIAEGPASGSAVGGFRSFGYDSLKEDYAIRFADLNHSASKEVTVFDASLRPLPIRVARPILDSDFRISVAPMKTHDTVIVTLALKNMLVGSLPGVEEKLKIHQGYQAINKNLYELARLIPPHLSIVDAFTAMEGDGPTHGTGVDMRVALCGTDFLAVDTVAAHLMGFDIDEIGYLHYCKEARLGEADLDKIDVIGNASLDQIRRKFKPHPTYLDQLEWRCE